MLQVNAAGRNTVPACGASPRAQQARAAQGLDLLRPFGELTLASHELLAWPLGLALGIRLSECGVEQVL
jgi:hypothetical protein